MKVPKLHMVKDEPTTDYILVGKNKKGLYRGRTAYILHYLFVYMMLCTVVSTFVFIGLLVEVIAN